MWLKMRYRVCCVFGVFLGFCMRSYLSGYLVLVDVQASAKDRNMLCGSDSSALISVPKAAVDGTGEIGGEMYGKINDMEVWN